MDGGIRVSKFTNTVVIYDVHRNSLYINKWVEDTLYYVESGEQDDQSLTRSNKSLAEAEQDGRTNHIFKLPIPNEYIYHGIAKIIDYERTLEDAKQQAENASKEKRSKTIEIKVYDRVSII